MQLRGNNARGPGATQQKPHRGKNDDHGTPKAHPQASSQRGGGKVKGKNFQAIARDDVPGNGPQPSLPVETPTASTRPATRKSNQDRHPGLEHHHRYTTKRRTKEQIEHDRLEDAKKLLAARQKTIQEHQSQIQSAAIFEATHSEKTRALASVATRPDLAETMEHAEHVASMAAELEAANYESDLPSSHMDDLMVDSDAGDKDYEDDAGTEENYVLGNLGETEIEKDSDAPNAEVEASYDQRKEIGQGAGSKASKRGFLREAILKQVRRSTPASEFGVGVGESTPPTANDIVVAKGKRKAGNVQSATAGLAPGMPGPGLPMNAKPLKRAKVSNGIGGLRREWEGSDIPALNNNPYTSKSAASSGTSLASDLENSHYSGEFQEDEDVQVLEVVRANKGPLRYASQLPVQGVRRQLPHQVATTGRFTAAQSPMPRQTKQMGIKIETNNNADEVDIDLTVVGAAEATANEDSKAKRKESKYVNADLPFPQTQARQALKKWQHASLPMLYEWAGSLPKPFSSNSDPAYTEEVHKAWCDNFPHLAHEKNHPAIESLAGSAIRNWRSEVGKVGLRVVDKHVKGLSEDEIALLVASLSDSGRFVYAFPDGEVGQRGAWESDLIAEVFAYHVNVTSKIQARFWPVGALALSAASVERALDRLKGGKVENPAKPFSDTLWGDTADQYAKSTANIGEEKWDTIFETVAKFLPAKATVIEDTDEFIVNYGRNPRTMIAD